MTPIGRLLALLVLGTLCVTGTAADGKRKGNVDPRGRPDERLMNQTKRYFIWHDAEGWHLRSASKLGTDFDGSIRVVGGTVVKFRPAGAEQRTQNPDRWALNRKRQKVTFAIHTVKSFDGIDFTVDGEATSLQFDLRIDGEELPKRIYIGRDRLNPDAAAFSLPADPDKAFAGSEG